VGRTTAGIASISLGLIKITGAGFVPLMPCQGVQIPAQKNIGRLSSRASHVGVLRGFVSSLKLIQSSEISVAPIT